MTLMLFGLANGFLARRVGVPFWLVLVVQTLATIAYIEWEIRL